VFALWSLQTPTSRIYSNCSKALHHVQTEHEHPENEILVKLFVLTGNRKRYGKSGFLCTVLRFSADLPNLEKVHSMSIVNAVVLWNKKAVLSQRWPRDARYISRS